MFSNCVFISGVTPTTDHTEELRTLLNGYNFTFTEVNGCYQGVTENSFKVEVTAVWQVKQLITIGKVFNQESILSVNNSNATLIYCIDNSELELGILEENTDIEDNYSEIDGIRYAIAS
jgi:hypothetical protein